MRHIQEYPNMTKWCAKGLALAVSIILPCIGWAQNAIRSIDSSQQAGAEVVRIELEQPLAAVPAGFAIQTPPRIAIDLPGVTNAMGRNSVEVNQGNLRSVSIAQAGDRTRLVLNLKQPSNYSAQLQGNALLVVLDAGSVAAAPAGAAPAAAAPATTQFAPSQNREPLALRDIDFRRGADGAGRVIVNLPSSQVGVDIRQQGKSLVVEFLRSQLPANLRRKLDVTDFGTPVQTVTTMQSGDTVRMAVESTGLWEHSAYQSDNQFVLEVRPQKVDPNKLTQGPGYSGEKLSLNFQNIEVRALLQVIADFTNFNVVTSESVTGNVTLRLKDVPWDQALDIILQAKGLGQRKSGNVIWIAPKDEIAAREKVEYESKAQIASLEPLRTQSFQLNYSKAQEVAAGLTGQAAGGAGGGGGGAGGATRILSPRGSVIFETRTNQLFVTDIPSKLDEISQLIAKIDIPVRQVLIEARIVEASDTFGKSLGARLGFRSGNGTSNNMVAGGSLASPNSAGGIANTNLINLPALGQGGNDPATFAVSLFNSGLTRFINLEISALEADGKGKVVSSPRIITADQVKASIKQGTKVPFQKATSSGATSVEFLEATLKLEVTPQITPEGNVILDVQINKDSLGTLTSLGREINVKEIKTQVLVDNGGTVVIGGIFEQTESDSTAKVPLLGDIPVLGHLFKTNTRDAQRTELLIFLTPKVVSDRATASR
jgi:type IV pilus assembly protein PilQ